MCIKYESRRLKSIDVDTTLLVTTATGLLVSSH